MVANVIAFPVRKKKRDGYYNQLINAKQYFVGIINVCEMENKNSSDTLFSGMYTSFRPHTKEERELYLSFYNAPSKESWEKIRDRLIDPKTTTWQLWSFYDKESPKSLAQNADKEKFPDPVLLNQYYNKYKVERLEVYNTRLKNINELLLEYQ